MTSYEAAVERLYALGHELAQSTGKKFELAHVRTLCRALGDPQHAFPAVLIAGTNGKGSTAATLASILRASGLRTGLFTSPHLVRINERIALDGAPVEDAVFARAFERVHAAATELVSSAALPHPPSFFEMLTAMAFVVFAEAKVDVAVLEVGMGGRLDATNIVEPVLTVITDIDLDHQKFLGNTIAEIAAEKAGILRAGVTAITLPQHPEANRVLGETMIAVGARAVSAVRNMAALAPEGDVFSHAAVQTRFPLSVLGREVEIVSPLVGRHQLRNLSLAITAAEELVPRFAGITAESIALGVRETRWPGRFQRLAATSSRPETIVDVAHNPAGAWALRAALSELAGERRLVLVFAAMGDKSVQEMAQILWPAMAHVVLTQVKDNPRAAAAAGLAEIAQKLGVAHSVAANVPLALEEARRQAENLGRETILVIAGSIYLAGEALPLLA